MSPVFKSITTAALLTFAGAEIGFAADDDSTPAKPVKCENGQIWDKKSKSCQSTDSNLINDDDLFESGRSFAYAGQYQHAIDALSAIKDHNQAKVLNMLGYANRKLGRKIVAMDYYVAALEIDPNYLLARSYMGQALANEGKFDAARDQLAEIRNRSGRETWAYVSLKQHLGNTGSY